MPTLEQFESMTADQFAKAMGFDTAAEGTFMRILSRQASPLFQRKQILGPHVKKRVSRQELSRRFTNNSTDPDNYLVMGYSGPSGQRKRTILLPVERGAIVVPGVLTTSCDFQQKGSNFSDEVERYNQRDPSLYE